MPAAWSPVELAFLAKSGREQSYLSEKVKVIETENVYELGQIVAITFLEWVTSHPKGVIALPTGRTPEYFIKTIERFRENWGSPELISELSLLGFQSGPTFPTTNELTFVQLDEFFPISSSHRNAFYNYVQTYYIQPLGISPERVLHFDLVKQGVLSEEELESSFPQGVDVDLTLLTRPPAGEEEGRRKVVLEKVQHFCDDFDARVKALGGIGLFLGGIGPDGHIAFNQEGCDHSCRTRLVGFNYPTAAAAAGDLGGIEIARGKAAMTIGLSTIVSNPEGRAIIMAAGEGKAQVVRAAIEDPASPLRPASCLHAYPGARFYLTHGAASALTARKAQDLSEVTEASLSWALSHLAGTDQAAGLTEAHLSQPPAEYIKIESLVYAASRATKRPVHTLTTLDLSNLPLAKDVPQWLMQELNFKIIVTCAARRLREKIAGGLLATSSISLSILHTAPHHDDIMLSYHGAMHEMLGRHAGHAFKPDSVLTEPTPVRGVSVEKKRPSLELSSSETVFARREHRALSFGGATNPTSRLGERYNGNVNHFAYLTSGFHSVNDSVLQLLAEAVLQNSCLQSIVTEGQLSRDYDELMIEFHQAFIARDEAHQDAVERIIFLRKVAEVWAISPAQPYSSLQLLLTERVTCLLHELRARRPGDATPKELQLLKGCVRESEVDRVWALSSIPMNRIHHLRSKFYNDDFFVPMPNLVDDALPFANLLRDRQPDLLTVAFDPEGTGPDTHFKVLQLVAAGLKISLARGDLKVEPLVWGYRNVWFQFSESEATIMIPCSRADLDLMHDTFMSCFTTQKNASYPSPSYDGPFSAWAAALQVQQRESLVDLLGENFFSSHRDERVRTSSGFVFLKCMHAQQFLLETDELRSKFVQVPSFTSITV